MMNKTFLLLMLFIPALMFTACGDQTQPPAEESETVEEEQPLEQTGTEDSMEEASEYISLSHSVNALV